MLPTGERGRLGASGVRSGWPGDEVSMASLACSSPKLSAIVFWKSLRNESIIPLTSVLAEATEQHEVEDEVEMLERTERSVGMGGGGGGGAMKELGGGRKGTNGGGPGIDGGGGGGMPEGIDGRGGIGG